MHRNPPSSLLKAVAPLIVAGTFTVAATAAPGIEPATPTPLPESAFEPVTVAGPVAGRFDEPGVDAIRVPPRGAARDTEAIPDEAALAAMRAELADSLAAELPDRPQPNVREPQRIVVDVPPPEPPKAPTASVASTTHVLRGQASWYCRAGVSPCTSGHSDGGGFDAYAAAGPKLRAAIGPAWRGAIVSVNGIRVKLIDWCQCYRGEPQEKLLDLYYDVYSRTGGAVTIRW